MHFEKNCPNSFFSEHNKKRDAGNPMQKKRAPALLTDTRLPIPFIPFSAFWCLPPAHPAGLPHPPVYWRVQN